MEVKATLEKPYTERERIDFIVINNYQQGYEIKETNNALEAWGFTEEELLANAKQVKYNEANEKATRYLQDGDALYEFKPGKHIEATDGNIGKFTGYMVGYILGQLQPTDTVVWNTKEDETVELSQEQIGEILAGLGQVQAIVWATEFPAFVQLINEAATVEEVNAIEIVYGLVPPNNEEEPEEIVAPNEEEENNG